MRRSCGVFFEKTKRQYTLRRVFEEHEPEDLSEQSAHTNGVGTHHTLAVNSRQRFVLDVAQPKTLPTQAKHHRPKELTSNMSSSHSIPWRMFGLRDALRFARDRLAVEFPIRSTASTRKPIDQIICHTHPDSWCRQQSVSVMLKPSIRRTSRPIYQQVASKTLYSYLVGLPLCA